MYLSNKIRKEGIGLIVGHPVVPILSQHFEGSLEELQALEVDSGVGLKEAQGNPAKEKIHTTNSSLLEGSVSRNTLSIFKMSISY